MAAASRSADQATVRGTPRPWASPAIRATGGPAAGPRASRNMLPPPEAAARRSAAGPWRRPPARSAPPASPGRARLPYWSAPRIRRLRPGGGPRRWRSGRCPPGRSTPPDPCQPPGPSRRPASRIRRLDLPEPVRVAGDPRGSRPGGLAPPCRPKADPPEIRPQALRRAPAGDPRPAPGRSPRRSA